MALAMSPASKADPVIPYEKPQRLESPVPYYDYSDIYTAPTSGENRKVFKDGLFNPRPYHIYVPDTAQESRSQPPLMLLLHGSGRTGASMIDKWRYIADEDGFIIVAPDADQNKSRMWVNSQAERAYLLKLINAVKAAYNTDPRRTYIFGHSAGGAMALAMAALESRNFAAAGVHAGTLTETPDNVFFTEMRQGMPVVFITGTKDASLPLQSVWLTADAFWMAGARIKQYEIEEHNHWYYDIGEFINILAWEEMQNHSLPETAR